MLARFLLCALLLGVATAAPAEQAEDLAAINTKKANAIVAQNKIGVEVAPCPGGAAAKCAEVHPRYEAVTGDAPVLVAHTGKMFTVNKVNKTKPVMPVMPEAVPSKTAGKFYRPAECGAARHGHDGHGHDGESRAGQGGQHRGHAGDSQAGRRGTVAVVCVKG